MYFSTGILNILSRPLALTIMNCYTVRDLYSLTVLEAFEAFEILPETDRETLLHSLWNTFQHSLAVSGC